jgi:4-hydroxybenzoate polyprenyltransferase
MSDGRPLVPQGVRVVFAVIGLASLGAAVGALIWGIPLTAVGSLLSATVMGIFYWNTRPRRNG